jgi:hypothetical protein
MRAYLVEGLVGEIESGRQGHNLIRIVHSNK